MEITMDILNLFWGAPFVLHSYFMGLIGDINIVLAAKERNIFIMITLRGDTFKYKQRNVEMGFGRFYAVSEK